MPPADSDTTHSPLTPPDDRGLVRGIGLWQATALNMIDMIGVGAVHHDPPDGRGDARPAGDARLGPGRAARRLRRPGVGGAGRGAAAGGRAGPLSARDVWPARRRLAGVPLRLAADVQRAAVDGVGMHRLRAVRRVSLAGAAATIASQQHSAVRFRASAPRVVEFTITNGTFLAMGDGRRSRCSCSTAASRSSAGSAAFLWIGVIGTTLWIIFSGLTHFSAAQAFTFPPGAWELDARVLHRPRRGAADRGVRLLGLLQRLLSGRRDRDPGRDDSARDPAVDCAASRCCT